MTKFFRNIIPVLARIIPTPAFSEITFYRHKEGKYLYYCMSEHHIKDNENSTAQQKFFELFPKSIRISQLEFDLIHYFRWDIEIVEVADEHILAMMDEEAITKESLPFLENGHEESEDKNINDN